MSALCASFLATLPEEQRHSFQALPGLPEALAHLWQKVEAAWPGRTVTEAPAFFSFLAAHMPEGLRFPSDLLPLHAEDLFHVHLLGLGDEAAGHLLHERHQSIVLGALARQGGDRPQAADIWQQLCDRLLAPEGGRYSGRGPLRAWLCVSALRLGAQQAQRRAREVTLSERVLSEAASDLELGFLLRHYALPFREALEAAIASLTPAERNLLRFQAIDHLTLEEIGAMHGVNKSTIARWLDRSRGKIRARTRAQLLRRAQVPESQVSSLLALLQGQIELTLRRVL